MNEHEAMEKHCPTGQRHVHEFVGSTKLAECRQHAHNHRFAGVTEEAIPFGAGNHVHKIRTKTDFYEDHYHYVYETTGPAIPVGEGRHIHFVCGATTEQEEHEHNFVMTTLVNDPIGD